MIRKRQQIIGQWRADYDTIRPHSSPDNKTPAEYAAISAAYRFYERVNARPPEKNPLKPKYERTEFIRTQITLFRFRHFDCNVISLFTASVLSAFRA